MEKVISIHHDGIHAECFYDKKEQYNKYKLYKTWTANNKYGYPTRHRKMVSKYEDVQSVLYHIAQHPFEFSPIGL